MSLTGRLEKTNKSIFAIFKLAVFVAFWVLVLGIFFAFGKDVVNKLSIEKEKMRFQVEICLNEYRSKLWVSYSQDKGFFILGTKLKNLSFVLIFLIYSIFRLDFT